GEGRDGPRVVPPPCALGLVGSFNRPSANVTGIANLSGELAPKQLQLLRQVIPNAALFGLLVDPVFPAAQSAVADLQAAAVRLASNSLLQPQDPTAISNRPSQLFRNSASVRS